MPNERPLTPEEIEQLRAYGRALSQPQEVKHSGHALANILNAISGQRYMGHAGTNEYMNRITEGARDLPPHRSNIPGGNVRPQISTYPPQTGAINLQQSPAVPQQPIQQTPIQQPPAPQMPQTGGQPQIPDFNAEVQPVEQPQQLPQQQPNANLAPSQVSPRVAELFQNPEGDSVRRYVQRLERQPSQVDRYLMNKYGANFVIDAILNPNAPAHELFRRHVGNTAEAGSRFMDSLPAELAGIPPTSITAQQWYNAWKKQSNNIGIDEDLSGRMNLGAPTEETQLSTEPREPLNSPNTGVSPEATAMPFRRLPEQTSPLNRPSNAPPSRRPRTAQAGEANPQVEMGIEQFAQAIPAQHQPQQNAGDKPVWVADVLPNTNSQRMRALERQLSNAGSLPRDRLNTLSEEYGKLTAAKSIDTGFGIAQYEYNPESDRFEYVPGSFTARPQTITTPSGSAPAVPIGPNNLNIPDIGSPNSNRGRQTSMGGGQDMRVPPHPMGDFFGQTEQHAQDVEATRQLSTKAVEALNSARDAGLQAYEIQSTLDLLRTETERSGRFSEGGAFRGPGAEWIMKAKQLLSNFGVEISGLDSLPPQEQIQKIITQLGSAATRQLSNRPANFEFQTILNAFPGMATSYEGANILIDYLQQVQDRAIEIGNMAESLPVGQRGRWNRVLRDFYEENPIILNIPAGPMLQRLYGINTPIRVTTKRISPHEERLLPPDMYFFRGGELYRGDGAR